MRVQTDDLLMRVKGHVINYHDRIPRGVKLLKELKEIMFVSSASGDLVASSSTRLLGTHLRTQPKHTKLAGFLVPGFPG